MKNKVRAYGEIVFTENLFKNDGMVTFQFKQCPTDTTCNRQNNIEMKGICQYLTTKSMFAGAVGENFTPHIACPIKKGTYTFNMTVFLQKLLRFPFAKFRTKGKMIAADMTRGRRNVVCMEGIVTLKD